MFKENATALYALGYEPIPVNGKVPVIKGWSDIDIDLEQVVRWEELYPYLNIGVRHTNGFDADIYHQELSDMFKEFLTEYLQNRGILCFRYGQLPKFFVPVNANGSTKQFSSSFRDDEGNLNRVELLGKGNQWVAYGMHPDTKSDYVWDSPHHKSFTSVDHTDLPMVSEEDIEIIFDKFEEMAFDLLLKPESRRNQPIERDPEPQAYEPEGSGTDLKPGDDFNYRNDIRDLMTEYGWHFTGRSTTLPDGSTSEQWTRPGKDDNSCGGTVVNGKLICYSSSVPELTPYIEGGTDGVYSAWAFYTAMEFHGDFAESAKALVKQGYGRRSALDDFDGLSEEEAISYFNERFIGIASDTLVADTEMPADVAVMRAKEFLFTFSCYQVPESTTNFAKKWLASKNRKTVRDTVYAPGKSQIFVDCRGVEYYNKYNVPEFPYTEETDRLDLILDHFHYLVNDGFEWYLNWFANLICQPHERSTMTPLLISAAHGTGRGWIDSIVRQLLGPWNCASVSMDEFAGNTGSKSNFMDFLHESLYVSIPEARGNRKKLFEVDDSIREKLTAEAMHLNLKYGAYKYVPIFAQVHMATNYRMPLKLEKVDRRIWVKECLERPKDADYYNALYAAARDPEVLAQFYWWLHRRSISMDWNPKGNAPMTREKATLVELFTGTPLAAALTEIVVDDANPEVATFAELKRQLFAKLKAGVPDSEKHKIYIDDKELLATIRSKLTAANSGKRLNFGGTKATVWILRSEKRWVDSSIKELREEMEGWKNISTSEDAVKGVGFDAIAGDDDAKS